MSVLSHHNPLRSSPLRHADSDSNLVNTFADRHLRSTSANAALGLTTAGTGSSATDINREVAALSDKLIRAINHQTDLDDSLVAAREDLHRTRNQLHASEEQNRRHEALVKDGSLVRKDDVDARLTTMTAQLAEEKSKRGFAEKEKKRLEQEVETLTTALFEEANLMVASARHDTERMDKKNEQLKGQLQDMELLLTSHQAQLAQLKQVIEQINEEHEVEIARATAPNTPQLVGKEFKRDSRQPSELSMLPPRNGQGVDYHRRQISGDARHSLRPAFRSNIPAHTEFIHLFASATTSRPGTRPASATFGGLNVSGIHGSSLPVSTSQHQAPQLHSNHSNSSINSDAPSTPAASTAPTTPQSVSGQFSPKPVYGGISLREYTFYKRVISEDVEPTLRLDLSPVLSWLNRRTVLNAVLDGNLVVEPVPPTYKHYLGPCALCGEDTRNLEPSRRFQFRTNQSSDTKKRYPGCDYCIARLRTTCDFVGFLRMIKDGHWKGDSLNAERAAWEECIRLREQMFWARIGRTDLLKAPRSIEADREVSSSKSASSSTESLKIPKRSTESASNRPEPISKQSESDVSMDETPTEPKSSSETALTNVSTIEEPHVQTPPPKPMAQADSEVEEIVHSPVKDLDYERISEESRDWVNESTKRRSLQKLDIPPKMEFAGPKENRIGETGADLPESSVPGTPQHEIPGAFN